MFLVDQIECGCCSCCSVQRFIYKIFNTIFNNTKKCIYRQEELRSQHYCGGFVVLARYIIVDVLTYFVVGLAVLCNDLNFVLALFYIVLSDLYKIPKLLEMMVMCFYYRYTYKCLLHTTSQTFSFQFSICVSTDALDTVSSTTYTQIRSNTDAISRLLFKTTRIYYLTQKLSKIAINKSQNQSICPHY